LKINLLALVLCLCSLGAAAQKKVHVYYLQFDSKDYTLSENDLPIDLETRRHRAGHIDSLDYPVNEAYLNVLCCVEGIRMRFASRWLNGVVVEVDKRADSSLFEQLAFVTSHRWLGIHKLKAENNRGIPESHMGSMSQPVSKYKLNSINYGIAEHQNRSLNLPVLHEQGYLGKGVKVAVFDAGFLKANRLPAFSHLFDGRADNGEIQISMDLIHEEQNVWDDDDHGLHVLSCLAAWDPEKMIGAAPFADYYLFRTENAGSEYVIEEYYWLRAAEIADSLGIDIINSSLGYNEFDASEMNYTHEDLDGKTSIIARAAQIAIDKGIIIVNAAGNEGNKRWKTLISPADVEQVISVGAIDKEQNTASFSSHGPTADQRIKPDVVALGDGTGISVSYGGYTRGNGTSYSAPIISGALACMKEKYPDMDPVLAQLLLRKASDRNNQPDNFQGWGMPNMQVADFFAGGIMGKHTDVVMRIADTTNGSLSVAIYHPEARYASLKVHQHKKFLGLIPFKKVVHKKEVNLAPSQMFHQTYRLDRYTQQGTHSLKVKVNGPEHIKVIIAQSFENVIESRPN
jgi:serine protease AprX